MRLQELRISYANFEGVDYPVAAHARLVRTPADPPSFLFDAGGSPLPSAHTIALDLLDPKPEADPNANLSDDTVAQIKASVMDRAKDGVLVMILGKKAGDPATPTVVVPN